MTDDEQITHDADDSTQPSRPAGHYCRYKLAALRFRFGALGRQSQRLGRWLESEVLPLAARAEIDIIQLDLLPEGVIRLSPVDGIDAPLELADCGGLCAFLAGLSIHRLELGARLESNQIVDVLRFLYAHRRAISTRHDDELPVAQHLGSGGGLHFCCTHVRLRGYVLSVEYSYCMTRLSKLVHWFESKHLHFSDHRALFHAAPQYGALAAALVLAVLGGYLLTDSLSLLIVSTAVVAVVLFVAIYLFFRGMGSIEYDNEEKAYRLGRAHTDLTRYAGRIRRDLVNAQTVQQKLLPHPDQMPLPENLQWVSSFHPETEVGGDYFDAVQLDNDRAAIVFADVSGHGMAAALITVIVKMAFQSWVQAGWSLSEFVRCVNRYLCQFTPDGSFVVLIAGVYDRSADRLTFVNCGHSPQPFYLPADATEAVTTLDAPGAMLLGVEEDIDIVEAAHPLAPGDTVLLATDGLTEAMNVQGDLYGPRRLLDLLAAQRAVPVEKIVASLEADIATFVEGAEQTDDRTVLAFRIGTD